MDESWLLLQVNRAVLNSGLFLDSDIKSRVWRANSFRIGVDADEGQRHAFVAAEVRLLSGRDFSVREQLGAAVHRTIERCCAEFQDFVIQITVDVQEIESELYFKTVTGRR